MIDSVRPSDGKGHNRRHFGHFQNDLRFTGSGVTWKLNKLMSEIL